MKYLLLYFIKLYWFLIPEKKRRCCIFHTSCSHYVYNTTKDRGLLSGLKALKFRIRNCHPDFFIYTDPSTGEKKMQLRSGIVVNSDEIASRLLD